MGNLLQSQPDAKNSGSASANLNGRFARDQAVCQAKRGRALPVIDAVDGRDLCLLFASAAPTFSSSSKVRPNFVALGKDAKDLQW